MITKADKRAYSLTADFCSPFIHTVARGNHPNYFIRKRKMPLQDLLISTIGRKGLTTSMEIYHFFQKKRRESHVAF